MTDFATFADFATWLLTPAGLGLAVAVVVGLVKRWAVNTAATRPATRPAPVAEWIAGHLWIVSVAVAAVVAVGVTLIRRYGLEGAIEAWWPVIVLVMGATTWGASQAWYTTHKEITRGRDRDD